MATKYVDSAAAGANDGTSWTDAWTSLASANGVAAGDVVLVDDGHAEDLAAGITFSNGTSVAPIRILCVDKADDSLSTGAIFTATASITVTGNVFTRGVNWRCGSNVTSFTIAAGTDGKFEAEDTTFSVTSTGGARLALSTGTRSVMELRDCDVDFSGAAAAGYLDLSNAIGLVWRGGTYTCRTTATQTQALGCATNGSNPVIDIEGVNFSGTVTTFWGVGATTNTMPWVTLNRCTLPTYTNLVTSANVKYARQSLQLIGCVGGTITVPQPGLTHVQGPGVLSTTVAVYRTGGADDGEQANPYSWEMASDAEAADFVFALASPPITRWVDAGSQALKIYVASGVTLEDDEFWIEVLSPSEAGSATAQAHYRSTRAAPLATPAALTTDGTSTWNGTGVGTKQYATVTIAPTVAGPVTVRVHLAKASTTVYVDPVIEVAADVAGKSRFFEGVQAFDADGGGGQKIYGC